MEPPAPPVFRTLGSILFLTGPCTAIRRDLEPRARSRVAFRLPRLVALLSRRRTMRRLGWPPAAPR